MTRLTGICGALVGTAAPAGRAWNRASVVAAFFWITRGRASLQRRRVCGGVGSVAEVRVEFCRASLRWRWICGGVCVLSFVGQFCAEPSVVAVALGLWRCLRVVVRRSVLHRTECRCGVVRCLAVTARCRAPRCLGRNRVSLRCRCRFRFTCATWGPAVRWSVGICGPAKSIVLRSARLPRLRRNRVSLQRRCVYARFC